MSTITYIRQLLQSSFIKDHGNIWVKLRSRPKKVVFGPPICRGGVSQISDMRFQITLTSEHVADFCWVVFSDLGD